MLLCCVFRTALAGWVLDPQALAGENKIYPTSPGVPE